MITTTLSEARTMRFSPPAPGVSPACTTDNLSRALAAHGLIGIYTASTARFGIISVTADLTICTNGYQLWCTHRGQHHTWLAADSEATVTGIALARSTVGT
jgi:hypothetical protein